MFDEELTWIFDITLPWKTLEKMINLEEEARKRRERLKSSFSKGANENDTKDPVVVTKIRKRKEEDEDFIVPEGAALYDSTGAEILGLDSK